MTTDNIISSAFRYDAAYASICGTRKEQQDALYLDSGENCVFAAVCDGMGGLDGGSLASGQAIQTLEKLYKQKNSGESYINFYSNAADLLDEAVYLLRKNGGLDGRAGTTIVSAAIEQNQLYWFSVGDSRLYIIRNEEIVCATRDHNYFMMLNHLLQSGRITQDEYDREKNRGEALISYLGVGGIDVMDISSSPFVLQRGDILLLTSDGLYRCVSDEDILAIARRTDSAAEMVRQLIDLSVQNANGVQDNTTIIAIICKEFA